MDVMLGNERIDVTFHYPRDVISLHTILATYIPFGFSLLRFQIRRIYEPILFHLRSIVGRPFTSTSTGRT